MKRSVVILTLGVAALVWSTAALARGDEKVRWNAQTVCADLKPESSRQITRTGNGTSQETSRGASVDGEGSGEVREVAAA